METKIIGKYLKSLRRDAELTTREVSIRSGVSSAYISEVEQGKKTPSHIILKKLAPVYQVNYEELLTISGITPAEFEATSEYEILLKNAMREFDEKYQQLKGVIEIITKKT